MNKSVKWKSDASGQISGPGFHDGSLTGIAVSEDNALVVHLKNHEGKPHRLVLSGLVAVNVVNFWGGSIVGDLWWWPVKEAPDHVWDKLLSGQVPPNGVAKRAAEIIFKAEGSHFFVSDASYGAEVYAVGEQLSIEEEEAAS